MYNTPTMEIVIGTRITLFSILFYMFCELSPLRECRR